MSRVAVFETLVTNPGLNKLGIYKDRIFPNWSEEERPIPDGPFVILRWGAMDETRWQFVKDPVRLTIWVHYPLEVTNDHSFCDAVLDQCDDALRPMWDVPGEDGYTVSQVRIRGRSVDFKDGGFQTIAKNGAYDVLMRLTVPQVEPEPKPPPPEPGTVWWHGDGPPQTIIGSKPGDYYVDMLTGDVYQLGGKDMSWLGLS